MNTLIFDTETTGLVNDRLDPTDKRQPMPVQLGLKLDGPDRIERAAANLLIIPEAWSVSPKAAEITGITTEIAADYGIFLETSVRLFYDMVDAADIIVGHNVPFDMTVMRRACFFASVVMGKTYVDPFADKEIYCTMRAATPLCRLLPKRNGQFKWPKLTEAMKFFFNETLDGAHDALVDVRGTAKLHYHLLDTGVYGDMHAAVA